MLEVIAAESWTGAARIFDWAARYSLQSLGKNGSMSGRPAESWLLLVLPGSFRRHIEREPPGRDQPEEAVADRVPVDEIDPIWQVAFFECLSQQCGFVQAERPPGVDCQVQVGITPRPPCRPRAKDPNLRRSRQQLGQKLKHNLPVPRGQIDSKRHSGVAAAGRRAGRCRAVALLLVVAGAARSALRTPVWRDNLAVT